MGLDMYLEGEVFIWTNWKEPEKNPKMDGFRIKRHVLELGYWRKHPNLHGFIVNQFANGEDDCREIGLDSADIRLIIKTIKEHKLPETTGFFFGKSDPEDDAPTIAILEGALAWLDKEKENEEVSRSVHYHASW